MTDFFVEIPALIESIGLSGTVFLLLIILPYGFSITLLKELSKKQNFIETQQKDFKELNNQILQGILMEAQENTQVLQELSRYLAGNNVELATQKSHINDLARIISELNAKLGMIIQFVIERQGEKK